jgi:hypothetical protein
MYATPIPTVALTSEQFEKLENATKIAVRKDGLLLLTSQTRSVPS